MKEELADHEVVSLTSLSSSPNSSSSTILIAFDLKDAELDDHDIRTFVLYLQDNGSRYIASEIEIVPAYSSAQRSPIYYHASITNWLANTKFNIITSSLSTDLGILQNSTAPSSSSSSSTDLTIITPSEDTNRAQFPIDDDTGDDISPIGMCISLSDVNTKVDDPCMGVEDVTGKLPRVICLMDDGCLIEWWIFHRHGIMNDELSLTRALKASGVKASEVNGNKDNVEGGKVEQKNPFLSSGNPFGSSTSDAFKIPSNTTSAVDKNKDITGGSFGNIGFNNTSTNTSANTTSNTASNTNANTNTKIEQPTSGAFGSTGFGQAGSGSGFGQTGFGQAGFGKKQTQTQTANKTTLTIKTSFSKYSNQSTNGFGSVKQGESIFSDTNNGDRLGSGNSTLSSPFGNVKSSTSSPFGNVKPSTSSPFGNVKPSTSSPFGSLGDAKKNEPSPFASLRENVDNSKSSSPGSTDFNFGNNESPFNYNKNPQLGADKQKDSEVHSQPPQNVTRDTPFAESVESLNNSFSSTGFDTEEEDEEEEEYSKDEDEEEEEYSKDEDEEDKTTPHFGPTTTSSTSPFGFGPSMADELSSLAVLEKTKSEDNKSLSNMQESKAYKTETKDKEEIKESTLKAEAGLEADPEVNSPIGPVDPVEFSVFDGFVNAQAGTGNPIADKIRDIVAETQGQLQVLNTNIQLVANFIDAHEQPGKDGYRLSEVESLDCNQYNYTKEIQYLKQQISKVDELIKTIQDSEHNKIKLDRMYDQLSILERGVLQNLKLLKNRPLDVKDEQMQLKLRAKLKNVKDLEDKLLQVLMPIKAKNSLNATTVANIEKVLYQLHDQVLEKKNSVDDLIDQIQELKVGNGAGSGVVTRFVGGEGEEAQMDVSLLMLVNRGKLELRRRLRQLNSSSMKQIAF